MGKATKARATVICRRGDEILLVRKAESKWNLPGGRIEANENAAEAAIRELDEETGLELNRLEYLASHEFDKGVHHVFRQLLSETQIPRPRNEIAECRWFAPAELDEQSLKQPTRELLRRYCHQAEG